MPAQTSGGYRLPRAREPLYGEPQDCSDDCAAGQCARLILRPAPVRLRCQWQPSFKCRNRAAPMTSSSSRMVTVSYRSAVEVVVLHAALAPANGEATTRVSFSKPKSIHSGSDRNYSAVHSRFDAAGRLVAFYVAGLNMASPRTAGLFSGSPKSWGRVALANGVSFPPATAAPATMPARRMNPDIEASGNIAIRDSRWPGPAPQSPLDSGRQDRPPHFCFVESASIQYLHCLMAKILYFSQKGI